MDWRKNEAYTRVVSLFRRALVPFHGFSVLVSTLGFKRASLKFDSALGTRGFKSELWHTCSVLACLFRLSYVTCVACLFGLMALRTSYVTCTCVPCLFRLVAGGFKNELCHMCSVLVLAHPFKNELSYVCSVLVSTHGFKNELCYMWRAWFDLPTHVTC